MEKNWCQSNKTWINKGQLAKLNIIPQYLKKRDAKYKSVVNINLVECLLKILQQ